MVNKRPEEPKRSLNDKHARTCADLCSICTGMIYFQPQVSCKVLIKLALFAHQLATLLVSIT